MRLYAHQHHTLGPALALAAPPPRSWPLQPRVPPGTPQVVSSLLGLFPSQWRGFWSQPPGQPAGGLLRCCILLSNPLLTFWSGRLSLIGPVGPVPSAVCLLEGRTRTRADQKLPNALCSRAPWLRAGSNPSLLRNLSTLACLLSQLYPPQLLACICSRDKPAQTTPSNSSGRRSPGGTACPHQYSSFSGLSPVCLTLLLPGCPLTLCV